MPVAGDIPKRAHSNVNSWREVKNAINVLNQRIDELIPSGGGGLTCPADLSYLLENTTDGADVTLLPNRRILAAGANVTLTDAGAGSTLTVAASGVATNCFTTWTPDSGGNIVADSPSDTAILTGGTGISTVGTPGTDTITINLNNTAVTPAAYGSATAVGTFTVDQQGRLTAAANAAIVVEGLATALTAGSVAFSDGSNLTEDNANLFWDDTNNRLGVGINSGMPAQTGMSVSGEVDILHTAVNNDDHAVEIAVGAAGFGDVRALDIEFETGAISAGEDDAIILVDINEFDATGGAIYGLEVLATDGGADAIYGMKAGAVVGPVLQDSGTFANPTTGTNDTPSTDVPAMIDGSTGTNTTIFVADDDYILIGAAAPFTEIEFNIETPASNPGIKPTFGYSIAGSHQFTTFSPTDGTNGFRNSGVIAWDAADLTGHVANSDTGTFDLKITRTHAVAGSVSLFFAKTAATVVYKWDKDGNVTLSSVYLREKAAAAGDTAGLGQFWVKSDTPNNAYFTDDAGNDRQLAYAGGAFHDGFSDFVANEHIDHTSVTLTAGEGLSGGGDISANRTFTLDLNELPTLVGIAGGDLIPFVDVSLGNSGKKITWDNLKGAIALTNLFDVTIAAVAGGEILKYDGAEWINNTLAEAGISAVGHSHDISDDTNLAVTAPVVLTDDTLSVSAASTTATGVVELATEDEVQTGTDTTRAVVPDTLQTVLPPIGSIMPWLKSYTSTPATLPTGWVEADGSTLSDADSVYDGQVLPDLNGSLYMRGNTTSGGTGGANTHTLITNEMPNHNHTVTRVTSGAGLNRGVVSGTSTGTQTTSSTGGGAAHNNEPSYYDVVWIMRIK